MIDKKINNAVFYKKLAHLFYAIAMSDKKFALVEKVQIIDFVKKYWTTDIDILTNSRDIIFDTLKRLVDEKFNSQETFLIFKNYYLENKRYFSYELKEQILEANWAIAKAYGTTNKSELVLLCKIDLLFKD